MSTYADTGFLCSLYAPDAHTQHAAGAVQKLTLPLTVNWLHQLEFRNALRLRVFRNEITKSQRDASLNTYLSDFASGVLVHSHPSLQDITMESERLSTLFSETLGTRSLDILHVATALVLGSDVFLTFDRRQHALASAAGLNAPALV